MAGQENKFLGWKGRAEKERQMDTPFWVLCRRCDESHSFLAAGYSLLLQKYTRRDDRYRLSVRTCGYATQRAAMIVVTNNSQLALTY